MSAAPRSPAFKVICLHCDQSNLEYCSKVSKMHSGNSRTVSDQQQRAAGLVVHQVDLHKHRPEAQRESARALEHHQADPEVAMISTAMIWIKL